MFTKGSKPGMVLQGFFRIERFRGGRAGAVQAKEHDFWAGKAPLPDLMPARIRPPAVQAKGGPGAVWASALRAELLPGMGRPHVGTLREVAQARAEAGVVTSPVPEGRLRLIGHGKPLEGGIRARMEGFFGADFSGVRVHEGPAAEAMGALAFTLGETLYFAPGRYDPTTREGVELLGHELTHVVQQRDGRVSNPHGRGVAIVQDPGLEAEADAMGRRVAAELWAGASSLSSVQLATHGTRQGYARDLAIQRMIAYTGSIESGYIEFSVGPKDFHINFALSDYKNGHRIYHVTDKSGKKKIHYFFYIDGEDVTPCRPPEEFSSAGTSKMFNALNINVQNRVTQILGAEGLL